MKRKLVDADQKSHLRPVQNGALAPAVGGQH